MAFDYTPTNDALTESFWTFSIPSQSIAVPFLLVGLVNEPRVMFDRPSLGFGLVQIGVRGKLAFALVNDEPVPFHFSLAKASYEADPELLAASGRAAALAVSPDSGVVPAKGRVRLLEGCLRDGC
jgi:hydrocephalus-inducing protein